VLAQYGALDIFLLNVAIGCHTNLGLATAAWLRHAMECIVESILVSVTTLRPLDWLTLPGYDSQVSASAEQTLQDDLRDLMHVRFGRDRYRRKESTFR
jgi:hypothetical protein